MDCLGDGAGDVGGIYENEDDEVGEDGDGVGDGAE